MVALKKRRAQKKRKEVVMERHIQESEIIVPASATQESTSQQNRMALSYLLN